MASTVRSKVGAALPTELRIGRLVYEVFGDEANWVEGLEHAEDKNQFGLTNHHVCRIWIRPNLAPSQRAETLFHEFMHTVFHVAGWHQRDSEGHGDLEEYTVRLLSPWFNMALVDNPEVVAFLNEPT